MTRATTTIPFSTIKFIDNIPRLSDLTERLTEKLREIRMDLNNRDPQRLADGKAQSIYDLITDVDTARIRRRAIRYLERLHASTGTQHLPERDAALLSPLRGGLPVARIVTEHEADEVAAALHEGQAHERLDAGEVDPAIFLGVFVIKRDGGKRHASSFPLG